MTTTVVTGGQFGGEAKGKVTAYLARMLDAKAVVRPGGPNAGHTVVIKGVKFKMRQVPVGFVNPNAELMFAAGSVIDPTVLLPELDYLEDHGYPVRDRLLIDKKTVVMDDSHKAGEKSLREAISSTASGTGLVTAERVLRRPDLKFAGRVPELQEYTGDVALALNRYNSSGEEVMVEGTQGFLLSLYHAPGYPFLTSRDTTASSFCGECGIPPTAVKRVVVCFRTFPIRVGNAAESGSGPLPNEITWEQMLKDGGHKHDIERDQKLTTVTKTLRRIARFDISEAKRACYINGATSIAVSMLDYLHCGDEGVTRYDKLSLEAREFVSNLENETSLKASYLSTGAELDETIVWEEDFDLPEAI
jgi:adenylosuccinate synthase